MTGSCSAVLVALKLPIKSDLHIYQDMDDLLMWQDKRKDQKLTLENLKLQSIKVPKDKGFMITEDKIYLVPPPHHIPSVQAAKPVIDYSKPLILNTHQNFLG